MKRVLGGSVSESHPEITTTKRRHRQSMVTTPQQQRLLRLSKAYKRELGYFTEGENLATIFGTSIADLTHQAAADRLVLGEHFLNIANLLTKSRSKALDWRMVIGRYYYAMYHSMRAVSYFHVGGDDCQDHTKLFTSIPSDFPDASIRANELKNARLWRNEADYDPYPQSWEHFKGIAVSLNPIANTFVGDCRMYLSNGGCAHI